MIGYAKYLLPISTRSPIYLIHFVTSKCMGRCLHCFYWKEINRPENPLTPSEVHRVALSMGPILQLLLTGGEPYLRPDFDDLVRAYYRARPPFNIGIATSGYHTQRIVRSAETLIHDCPRSNIIYGLPIEGIGEENDRIRGVKGFFQRTTETLRELKRLKSSLSPSNADRFTLLVDITLSSFNQEHFEETYHYIRDIMRPDAINLIITRGQTRDRSAPHLDISAYERVSLKLENDIKSGLWKGYSRYSKMIDAKDLVLRKTAAQIHKGKGPYYPCAAGKIIGVLGPEGDIHGCEMLLSSFGNVREVNYDLTRIWLSPEAKRFRKKISGQKCRCFHQCFLSPSIFFNPIGLSRIICEWLRILI